MKKTKITKELVTQIATYLGRKGGETTAERNGHEHFQRIGKLGGMKRSLNIKAKKNEQV